MTNEQLFYSIISGVALLLSLYWGLGYWRQCQAERRPFPHSWLPILERQLPPYRYLPPELQEQLQQLVKMFVYHKRFIGCAGLEITDEIRVTIAAGACLLLLNRRTNEYSDLRWIYVYPSAFIAHRQMQDDAGVVSEGRVDLLGESWTDGKVILSWDDVERGVRDFSDGHNVVLHEFAHQLDHESGSTNGAPILRSPRASGESANTATYTRWAAVFAHEFAQLQREAQEGEQSLLDHYGATDPAEFFAVATETFFEKPVDMQKQHTALYNELKNYYQLDPAQWGQP